ncbi:MAG: hypothetical protein ACC660_00425 [Acidimicrobiales bacterium]
MLAGLTALALIAAACTSGLESPAETLRPGGDSESTFGYVVDPAPDGYALCAITTPSGLSIRPDASASLHVYADGSLDDPYSGPLYAVALFAAGSLDDLQLGDAEAVEVSGAAGWLGTLDGLQLADLPADGQLLTYRADAERIVQLAFRGDAPVDMVDLAASVLVDDNVATLAPEGLPPGFVDLGDVEQLEGSAQFLFSLDYQLRTGGDGELLDQLTLLGSAGDATLAEAFRFRAAVSERVDVNGFPGVVADVGSSGAGPYVVSWLVNDALLVRLFSRSIQPDDLLTVARGVRRIDGSEWDELRGDFDPGNCQFLS